jgi:hypothetical protein
MMMMREMDSYRRLEPRRGRLALQIAPRFVRHFATLPYRGLIDAYVDDAGPTRLKVRSLTAAFDACAELLIDGHTLTTSKPVHSGSGPIVIAYMRLLSALNREFEYRLARRSSLVLDDVVSSDFVSTYHRQWIAVASRFTSSPSVVDFIHRADVEANYNKYVNITTAEGFEESVDGQIRSIELDSGMYLQYLAEILSTLSSSDLESFSARQFFHTGCACKVADDLIDLESDRQEGRYNLVLALLKTAPKDYQRFCDRTETATAVNVHWLCENAPHTAERVLALFARHRDRVRVGPLATLCDVSAFRMWNGRRKDQRARGMVHVTQPPRHAWR